MTGYKGTNADMSCTPDGVKFQFELGKWYEHKGEIKLCGSGFHFCVHPSGPYAFYSSADSRIFKIEAEQVLEVPTEAGADFKLVAKRIRLVEEITPGYRGKDKPNDGDLNTGDLNTGNRNTGDWNAADRVAGFFCSSEPKVMSFDFQTDLTHTEYFNKYPQAYRLGELLLEKGEIEFEPFKDIPGITKKKLAALHAKHQAGRKS